MATDLTQNGAISDRSIMSGPTQRNRGSVLGWAVYLGTSWTWCIGMFLPVLLIRDYGLLGYIVFAVPNVVGAAAMGWVVRNAKISRELVARHRTACRAFSFVTIAFQVYFLIAFVFWPWLTAYPGWKNIASFCAVILGFALLLRRGNLHAAKIAWGISIAAFATLITCTDVVTFPAELFATRNVSDLLLMTPVIVFGFALCPYLDLTFHQAARKTPIGTTQQTFALGFGVFFLMMILGTLLYAAPMLGGDMLGSVQHLPTIAAIAIGVHLFAQLDFTTTAHSRRMHGSGGMGFIVGMTGLLAVIVSQIETGVPDSTTNPLKLPVVGDMHARENVYRCFMGFYGLVFPAYVWLCMIPRSARTGETPEPRHSRAISTRTLTVFAAAVVLATPCYWMGFIAREEIWLVPGLAIVLLARLFVKTDRGTSPAAS